jgi:site-specific recombinase XerD
MDTEGTETVEATRSVASEPALRLVRSSDWLGEARVAAVNGAKQLLGIPQRFTPHCFRHCFGTHLYESGVDIYRINELMGHKKLETTLVYVHMARRPADCIKSPLDR